MESNRDEAIRCLKLAEKYLGLGDKEKAEKFGQKAVRLFPSIEAKGKTTKCQFIMPCRILAGR